jgi:hypothetical protein
MNHLPQGLCDNKNNHDPHPHDSSSLGRFWCHADQKKREPYRSEVERVAKPAERMGAEVNRDEVGNVRYIEFDLSDHTLA